MKQFKALSMVLFCLLLPAGQAWSADEIDSIAGKWSAIRTNSDGKKLNITLEIKKQRFSFTLGEGKEVSFYADGEIKLEKLGTFQAVRLSKIKAGISADLAEPVDEERVSLIQLRDEMLYFASNFDKERREKPSLDIYKKVDK